MQLQDESECEDCKEMEEQLLKLQSMNIELMEANATLRDEIATLKSRKLEACVDGKYTDSTRVCIMDILSRNVGIKQVEPVIRAVLRLVGMECDHLPKHTTISEMLLESRALSQVQLAQTTLETLQEVLEELSQTNQQHGQGYSDAGKMIIGSIKNTMSDRASSQKAFNAILSEYRAEVLSQVVSNWNGMSEDEQQSMSQMYNFFCGMHLIVNMAETIAESLKLFEKAHTEDMHQSESESGTIRLVRTTCKAFEKRGNEKSGYPLQFNTYLNKHGIEQTL